VTIYNRIFREQFYKKFAEKIGIMKDNPQGRNFAHTKEGWGGERVISEGGGKEKGES
jgi:hypothetical protein